MSVTHIVWTKTRLAGPVQTAQQVPSRGTPSTLGLVWGLNSKHAFRVVKVFKVLTLLVILP